ncbi:MAG: DNA polymerase I [Gammaproteobacteria bacterium]|nr:DNA polymerase I [Gammaproteobacteria bacterium]|tara:strand:+ start:3938 stop:6700 length:2763 start_codon:yes stop_codon:yes gene_type:complete
MSKLPEQPLILIDGSSYLFRAYHALPPLTTTKGQATGAVKGVINMVRSLIKEYPDSPVAVVFDAKGKTFRSDIYKEYKAHRPPMPDDLRTQIEPIHEIIKAMGLPLIVEPGVEADDVIGTLAQQASESKLDTLISTGDKDLAQLVNEHVTLLNTMTREVLDIDGVREKFGLGPEQIIDYLGLTGDKSDNIPGVPGVGPKTAVKWLEQYGTVDELIKHADDIKGKAGENLREHIEQLKLSQELATIKCDVELSFKSAELKHADPDQEALLGWYKRLEFRTWIRELEEEGVEAEAIQLESDQEDEEVPEADESEAFQRPDDVEYNCILENKDLDALCKQISQAERLAISLETDGAHYKLAKIIGLSFSLASGKASYIPLAHESEDAPDQLAMDAVLDKLKPVLEDKAVFKAGHDLKTVCHVLKRYGISLAGCRYDTMLQSYVLNSVAHKHTLDKLSSHYLEEDKLLLEELLGKGRNKLTYAQVPLDKATQYSAQNADFVYRLQQGLEIKLNATAELADVYRYKEIALMPVLFGMEEQGITVDQEVLAQQSEKIAKRLQELEQEAYEMAGEEFNLGSPAQLQTIFYEKLDYPVISKTAKGKPSTAEPVLQELALEYPLPKLLLEHRMLSKLKSTYTDKLPQDVNPQTGRIHSSFQQAVAATGRLSSTEPNLQNIPIRSEEGRRVRKAFIPESGKVLMAADYSQVELRIMAHLSGDEGLRNAFREGLDVHRATAAEIFGVKLNKVDNNQRRSAKAINFGLIYGMSAFGLAKQLGIGRHEAQEYVERYFHRYPGVRDYMENTRQLANEQGYVETIFGRRLYLPDIHARNGMLRKAAERTAINAPMQGTAADIIKQAMIDIQHWLDVAELSARLLLQVHDELIFEVNEGDLKILSEGVEFRMASAAALDVPLVVDIGSGLNWDEAH